MRTVDVIIKAQEKDGVDVTAQDINLEFKSHPVHKTDWIVVVVPGYATFALTLQDIAQALKIDTQNWLPGE